MLCFSTNAHVRYCLSSGCTCNILEKEYVAAIFSKSFIYPTAILMHYALPFVQLFTLASRTEHLCRRDPVDAPFHYNCRKVRLLSGAFQ